MSKTWPDPTTASTVALCSLGDTHQQPYKNTPVTNSGSTAFATNAFIHTLHFLKRHRGTTFQSLRRRSPLKAWNIPHVILAFILQLTLCLGCAALPGAVKHQNPTSLYPELHSNVFVHVSAGSESIASASVLAGSVCRRAWCLRKTNMWQRGASMKPHDGRLLYLGGGTWEILIILSQPLWTGKTPATLRWSDRSAQWWIGHDWWYWAALQWELECNLSTGYGCEWNNNNKKNGYAVSFAAI